MITLRDLRELQDALTSVLGQNVFLRQALRSYLKDRRFTRPERGWARDFLHRSVQLKNRYWTAAEAFIKESPDREDQPLDFRYFFLYHYFHQKEHSPVDEAVYQLLEVKSRVRKFRRFLHETKQDTIFPEDRGGGPGVPVALSLAPAVDDPEVAGGVSRTRKSSGSASSTTPCRTWTCGSTR